MKYVLYGLAAVLAVALIGGLIYGSFSGPGGSQKTGLVFVATKDDGLTWSAHGATLINEPLPNLDVISAATQRGPKGENVYYIGTRANGLWRSLDGGFHWERLQARHLPVNLTVTAITTDPLNPFNIFVAGLAGNSGKLYRSKTFGETFQEVYTAPEEAGVAITSATVDPSAPNHIIIGTNGDGILLSSTDFGRNWKPQRRFKETVRSIYVNPQKPAEIFVLTEDNFWQSDDGGGAWRLPKEKGAKTWRNATRLIVDKSQPLSFFVIAGGELWQTKNAGLNWQKIDIQTQDDDLNIADFAISESNAAYRVLALGRTILTTKNAGETWAIKRFKDISKRLTRVIIDPNDSRMVIIGTAQPVAKGLF